LSALIKVFTLSQINIPDVIQRAAFAGGTNCTESHLPQKNCTPGGKVAAGVCVFARVWAYFSTKASVSRKIRLIREISDQSFRSFSVPNSQSLPACRELLLRVLWRDERAKEAGRRFI
jgi:hypothetical protein